MSQNFDHIYLSKFEVTGRKCAKCVSGLYLSYEKNWKYLLYTKTEYDMRMALGQVQGHLKEKWKKNCARYILNLSD